jgi:hypothetical protein
MPESTITNYPPPPRGCPTVGRYVKRCHNIGDVARLGPSSKVVIATGLSLEAGLSRELLVTWGADSRNAVIFTQPPPVSVRWCLGWERRL